MGLVSMLILPTFCISQRARVSRPPVGHSQVPSCRRRGRIVTSGSVALSAAGTRPADRRV